MEPTAAPEAEKTYAFRMKDDKLVTLGEHQLREFRVLLDAIRYMRDYETEVPIPDITAESFERCLKFLEFFKDEPPYVTPVSIFDCGRPNFFHTPTFKYLRRLNPDKVQDIADTAVYLNCPRLMDYMAYAFIHTIRDISMLEDGLPQPRLC